MPLDIDDTKLADGICYGECGACGRLSFPTDREKCAACGSPDVHGRRSARTAVLSTWTTVGQGPPEFETPYVLGWADLDEPKLPVLGHLRGDPGKGRRVRVATVEGSKDDAGVPLIVLEVQP